MPRQKSEQETAAEAHERRELLRNLNAILDKPLIVLSLLWIGLLVLDLVRGLSPALQVLTYSIWAIFIADLLLELLIAPDRIGYLRTNWLAVLSLIVPALRPLRIFRALRLLRTGGALRSLRLFRVLTSINRGMRAAQTALGTRGIGYVAALTTIVVLAGAAGIYQFENPAAQREAGLADASATTTAIQSYGDAIWWTAMAMTTMGSDYFPRTMEGRILGWLLAVYAFAMFGYITATIASILIRPERITGSHDRRGDSALHAEMKTLRSELAALRGQLETLQRERVQQTGNKRRAT